MIHKTKAGVFILINFR